MTWFYLQILRALQKPFKTENSATFWSQFAFAKLSHSLHRTLNIPTLEWERRLVDVLFLSKIINNLLLIDCLSLVRLINFNTRTRPSHNTPASHVELFNNDFTFIGFIGIIYRINKSSEYAAMRILIDLFSGSIDKYRRVTMRSNYSQSTLYSLFCLYFYICILLD